MIGRAELVGRAAEIVGHARAQIAGAASTPATPAPPPTFARWAKERESRPAIARIQPGDEIRREYAGTVHVVRCEFGFWLYAGERFPTLASVVVAIAGARQYPKQLRAGGQRPSGTRTGAICSAIRFFRLQAVV